MLQKNEERSQITLNSDGLKVFGVLHLPHAAKDKKVPGVLFCHGFGGNKSGKFRLSVRLSEQLSLLGIASLRIDFRGSGDSEGDFKESTIKSQLDDARLGMDFLQNHPSIDPSRLGLLGRSLGGCIATYLAAEILTLKALALWAPVFDASPWLTHYQSLGTQPRFFGERLSEACIAEFRELNAGIPLAKLSHLPTLLIHAGQDEVLGDYHYQKYLELQKEAHFLKLANSNHEFGNFEEQPQLLETTAAWFSNNL